MKPSGADLKGLSDPTSPDACDVAGRFLPDRSELCRAGWESKLFNAAADPDESQTATEHALEVPGFEIISQLGSGSSGEVWLADELEPGRIVALKIMHRHGGASAPPEILQREFQILGKLMHPNLVVLYHAILTKDGRHGLAMEWIDGWPLDEWLALHPDLSLEDKLELFRGMVRGVAFLHDNGVIHRDLKPANVIVDTNGTPKIVDFGLARLHYEGLATTLDGCSMGIAGTLHFMAPEQAADSSGSRAMPVDVYALGLMFHRILTGRWLRPADATPAETLALALNPPPLKWSGPDLQLPHDLRSIVRQSLETDPARRYRHARDLEADLQRFTSKLPVAAREHTAFYLATTFLRRQGRRSVVAGLLMVAGLAAGSVLYFRHRAVAERNEANLKHAYALTSFTLLQLRDELSTTTEDDPFGTSAGDFLPGPASESDPPLPINASGELDLRYYQALLADIRSVNSEAHSRYATALKSIRKALDLYSKLALESRDDPKRLLDAARARLAFARLLEQVGQMDGAGSHANKTLLQLDRLAGWQGADKTQLLTMRCDALGLLAKQAHQDGNSAEAVEVALEILTAYTEWLNKSGAPPGNGSIARLTKAASDLATYALAAGPVPLPDVRLKIDTATRICRAAHEREPGSFPLACCLARILYATARISLQTGADTEAANLLQEIAKLLIDTPSISKSSSLPLVWEISRIATDRAETLLDHPDPLVSSAALSLAQDFTTHLRRSGDGRDEVLIQRARIYLYQSRLNCRIQNRQSGCRPISIALEMLRPRQARDPENIPLSLLTAAALHQARSLSDFPEARWNEKQALYLASLIKQLSERKSELTPKLQQELESFK